MLRDLADRMGRHPSGVALGAYFDGEAAGNVAEHLTGCRRCQGRLNEFRRVRAAVQGGQVPPALAPAPLVPGLLAGRRPMLAPLAIGLVMALFALTIGPLRTPVETVARIITGTQEEPKSSESARPGERPRAGSDDKWPQSRPPASGPDQRPVAGSPGVPGVPGSIPPALPGPVATPPATTVVPPPPLRLGVAVNTSGPLAREGVEVVRAVRQAADAANRKGGAAGRQVDVIVVSSEAKAATDALAGRVDVMVGGFGVTPNPKLPWLFPADPAVGGPSVIAAELTPRAAGVSLGQDLVDQKFQGQVGVVTGAGVEATLAEGLAEKVRTTSVAATPDTTCERELGDLRKIEPAPSALAIAGPPELAARCVEAATRLDWKPSGGVLVAPSAAYGGLDSVVAARGARTVLGMPWPSSDAPAAVRFRAAVPDSLSYRALVSFVGAELAVEAVRRNPGRPVNATFLTSGSFQTDSVRLEGGVIRGAGVVALGEKGWTRPEGRSAP